MKKKIWNILKKIILFSIIIAIIGFIAQDLYINGTEEVETGTMNYPTFIEEAKENKIEKIQLTRESNFFEAFYKEGIGLDIENKEELEIRDNQRVEKIILPMHDDFIKDITGYGINVEIIKPTATYSFLMTLGRNAPLIIIFSILLFYMVFIVGGKGLISIGKNTMSNKNKNITFDDVAGLEEEKKELKHVLEMFKNPEKYTKMGAKPPRGILFIGETGTGKTLMAKAMANESGTEILYYSGSDFSQKFMGMGSGMVRNMFKEALKKKPCIVFIDEIDSVGGKRVEGSDGGTKESNTTINAFLEQMDGFGSEDGILFIGATNREDALDKAFVRPGRFEKKIVFTGPQTKEEREDIIKVHIRNKFLKDGLEIEEISKHFFGLSPAEIAFVLEEAVSESFKRGNDGVIGIEEIDSAFMKKVSKSVSKGRNLAKDKLRMSIHEIGHAIFQAIAGNEVLKVSIEPYGGIGGVTVISGDSDAMKGLRTKTDVLNMIKVLLAGKIAEEIVLGECSVGAMDDLKRATNILEAYTGIYCMDKNSLSINGLSDKSLRMNMNDKILGDMEDVAQRLKKEVRKVLSDNKMKKFIWYYANELKEKEVIYDFEIEEGLLDDIELPNYIETVQLPQNIQTEEVN